MQRWVLLQFLIFARKIDQRKFAERLTRAFNANIAYTIRAPNTRRGWYRCILSKHINTFETERNDSLVANAKCTIAPHVHLQCLDLDTKRIRTVYLTRENYHTLAVHRCLCIFHFLLFIIWTRPVLAYMPILPVCADLRLHRRCINFN